MNFFTSPGFILESGLSIINWYRQKTHLDMLNRNQTEDLLMYQSQRNVNNITRAINTDRAVKYANQQAGLVRVAFASSGLSGGTIESQVQSYNNSILLNALLDD